MKKIKPVGMDVYYKYLCNGCGGTIWASKKEASIQDFKLVCDFCDKVHSLARIKNLEIQYDEEKPKEQTPEKTSPRNAKELRPLQISYELDSVEDDLELDIQPEPVRDYGFIREAVDTLVRFGYNRAEMDQKAREYYEQSKEDSSVTIVKHLMCLGEFDNV